MGAIGEAERTGEAATGPWELELPPGARLQAHDLRGAVRAPREHLRERILLEIERRLADPDLCPTLVAEYVGVSRRYLHELFCDQGYTVGRWILERRLECSWSDILAPGEGPLRIGEIAMSNGFRDPSYFSRAFKRRFGMTPRELAAGARLAARC
jgi:AraC-like DNA-binding protein